MTGFYLPEPSSDRYSGITYTLFRNAARPIYANMTYLASWTCSAPILAPLCHACQIAEEGGLAIRQRQTVAPKPRTRTHTASFNPWAGGILEECEATTTGQLKGVFQPNRALVEFILVRFEITPARPCKS
jgi:hypothetical protein